MSTEAPLFTVTFKAGSDLNENRFVNYNSSGVVNETAVGEVINGVTRTSALAGENVGIHTHGIVTVEASGAIAKSELVSADNNGKAIVYDKNLPTPVAGYALNDVAAGQLVEVLLNQDTK